MSNMNQTIMDVFHFRHATKQPDSQKKVSKEDSEIILESGRLPPSSLGLEPWEFAVTQDQALRDELKAHSWGATEQSDTASHFVLIFARKNVTSRSPYIQHMLRDTKKYEAQTIPVAEQKFDVFQANFHISDNDQASHDWSSKQMYIVLDNMMTTAALLGIDSYPMEGFSLDTVTDILANKGILDTEQFGLSVMVASGYRQQDPLKNKTRQVYGDVIERVGPKE